MVLDAPVHDASQSGLGTHTTAATAGRAAIDGRPKGFWPGHDRHLGLLSTARGRPRATLSGPHGWISNLLLFDCARQPNKEVFGAPMVCTPEGSGRGMLSWESRARRQPGVPGPRRSRSLRHVPRRASTRTTIFPPAWATGSVSEHGLRERCTAGAGRSPSPRASGTAAGASPGACRDAALCVPAAASPRTRAHSRVPP